MKVVNTLRKLGHACRGMLAVACLWSMSSLLFTACDSKNLEENNDPIYAVDLGLSVKWAWCNVGASRPEMYGDYFAWGELATKSWFDRSNYAYYDSSQGDYEDIGANISGTAYDVVRDLWGDGWRLPTEEEMRELIEECTWEKGTLYGSDGMFVTGPNGNKIFLPNASGGYWSGTYSSTNYNYKYSSALTWDYSADVQVDEETCYTGLAIRPVKGELDNSDGPLRVDLGLSVEWASCNVGAESPEEYGDYFAWGETATKSSYDESNSAIYGLSISELESRGIIDAAGNLTAAYDAATVNWGEGWRMPTTAEIQELIDNCTWKWTTNDGTISGVYGYEVTAPNGNSIFLPPAGYYRGMSHFYPSAHGYYASVTNSMDGGVYCLHFRQGVYESYNFTNSAYGIAVRPVYSEDSEVEDSEVSNKTYTVNGVSFTMIGVEGGTFTMGSPDSDSDAYGNEKPAHQVTLSNYSIGETEVTQELWQAVMGSNPSYYTGDLQRPVEYVSWNNCQTFISKLNELTGESFRLPTEAEWEYAARGGKESKGYKYSGSNTVNDVAWYWDKSSSGTKAVKTKQPNELGIYDMSGNVYEWCSDWYGSYSSSWQFDPTGPSSGSYRVLRGGSWHYDAGYCRVAYRFHDSPDRGYYFYGFRLSLQFIP